MPQAFVRAACGHPYKVMEEAYGKKLNFFKFSWFSPLPNGKKNVIIMVI